MAVRPRVGRLEPAPPLSARIVLSQQRSWRSTLAWLTGVLALAAVSGAQAQEPLPEALVPGQATGDATGGREGLAEGGQGRDAVEAPALGEAGAVAGDGQGQGAAQAQAGSEADGADADAQPDVSEDVEEVEVTDRRRHDSPWQIPISNVEISGLSLRQRDIADLTTLSEKILGFFHSESIVSSDRFFLRGIGTIGTNPGLDQAVGLSIDGLNLARSRFGRTTFLDLRSVTLYKGAVNEASAKNSPAGHLQLRTVDAEPNYEGYASLFGHLGAATGAVLDSASNFPLSERWAMRAALRVELRDGWIDNPSIGRSAQQKRDISLRLKWNGELSRGRKMAIMLQSGLLRREGRNRELIGCLARAGEDDCTLDRERYGVPTREGGGGIGIEFFHTDYYLLAFEQTRQGASSQAGHLLNFATYASDDYYDADQSYTRQDHSLVSTEEGYSQFDYEYRWQSRRDSWFNFRLAVRFGASLLDFDEGTILCGDRFDSFGRIAERANCEDSSQPSFSGAQRNVDVSLTEYSLLYYNQFEFRLDESWRIELAARTSVIGKFVDGRAFLSEPWRPDLALRDPLGGGNFVSCIDYIDRVSLAEDFNGRSLVCHEPLAMHNLNYASENHVKPYMWQPSLTLAWSAPAQSIYLRASRSVKNFGYEIWPISMGKGFTIIEGLEPLLPDQYLFRGEFTNTYELGGNHSWLNDRAALQWSLWLTQIEDLQVSNYDAFLQRQFVANAAEASSRGVDVNLSYAFLLGHTLRLAAVYTLARYDNYPTAPCHENQTEAQGCTPLDRNSEIFTLLGRSQDLSGQSLEYAPRWQFTLGYDANIPLTTDWELGLSTAYYWRSRYYIGTTHHPEFDIQPSLTTIDARISFSSPSWQIALVGRNLTDSYAASFATSDAAHERVSVIGTPSTRLYTAFSRPGMELALNLRYSW